jgi:hypothetical protein
MMLLLCDDAASRVVGGRCAIRDTAWSAKEDDGVVVGGGEPGVLGRREYADAFVYPWWTSGGGHAQGGLAPGLEGGPEGVA